MYDHKPFKRLTNPGEASVVGRTDLWDKTPNRPGSVKSAIPSGHLGSEMVSTVAWNGKTCGVNSCWMCDPSHFHQSYDTGVMTRILYKLCTLWLLNQPCGNVCKVTAYNSIGMSVVGCTDLSGKELHRPVGMGIVVTSEKPMWCNGQHTPLSTMS